MMVPALYAIGVDINEGTAKLRRKVGGWFGNRKSANESGVTPEEPAVDRAH